LSQHPASGGQRGRRRPFANDARGDLQQLRPSDAGPLRAHGQPARLLPGLLPGQPALNLAGGGRPPPEGALIIVAGRAVSVSLAPLGSLRRGGRSVDQVGAEQRAAALASRSIKKGSKLWALDLAIRCMDLTTLEGADTPGKVAALAAKAVRPHPGD